jgi:hypothetical protein
VSLYPRSAILSKGTGDVGPIQIGGELALRQAQGERTGFFVRPELVEGRLSPNTSVHPGDGP